LNKYETGKDPNWIEIVELNQEYAAKNLIIGNPNVIGSLIGSSGT
jgi:hypothetical protein